MTLLLSFLFAIAAPAAETPRQASFHVRNAFVVKVPKGAQKVRVWFAVPQQDAQSAISNFAVNP